MSAAGLTPEEITKDMDLTLEQRVMLEPLYEGLSNRDRDVLRAWAQDTMARANLLNAAARGRAGIVVSDGVVRFTV